MRTRRGLLLALGVLLLLPLAATLVGTVLVGVNCESDCGDRGGRGVFILVLLSTPLAAAGVLALARATRPKRGVAWRTVVTPVVLCTVLLAGTAVAAGIAGVEKLTEGPRIHYVGDPDAGRKQADDEGVFLLVVGGALGLMATGAVVALRAASRARR